MAKEKGLLRGINKRTRRRRTRSIEVELLDSSIIYNNGETPQECSHKNR